MKRLLFVLFTFFTSVLLFAKTGEVIIPVDKNSKSNDSLQFFVIVEEMPIFKYKNCNSTIESFLRYVSDNIVRKANLLDSLENAKFVKRKICHDYLQKTLT